MTGDDPTRADERGPNGTERVPPPTSFVGRAKPPAPPARPTTDPYWPPLDGEVVEYASGYPPMVAAPRRRRSGLTVLLVVVGVFAACCASGALLALFGGAIFQGASEQVEAAPPGLNTPVRDGRFEFVVTRMSCGHASVGRSFVSMRASGQFCIVDLSVTNIGTDAQTFADNFQNAFGPDGAEYGASTGAGVIANEGATSVWNVINPGNTATGKIVYDIPKDAQITALELHDSAFSEGTTVSIG